MSVLKVEEVHDFKDGEVHIKVTADFTAWYAGIGKPEKVAMIKADFEKIMQEHAI